MNTLYFSNELARTTVQEILRVASDIPLPEACLLAKAQIDRRTFQAAAQTGSKMELAGERMGKFGDSSDFLEALTHLGAFAFESLSSMGAGAQVFELQRASAQLMEKYMEALQLEYSA